MGANGSVASPSRLGNAASRTYALPGGGDEGPVAPLYGAVTQDAPPSLGAHPWDTGAELDTYYVVDKSYRFANTGGLAYGQIPVPYDPALSRTLSTSGAKPSAIFSASTKTYPNASYRRSFGSWRQRFPNESAAPGEGMWRVSNRYYPSNLPSQLATGQAPPGRGATQRGQGAIITPFVTTAGRGMAAPSQNLQTRLAPSISYSSTTNVLGGSVFNAVGLGG